MQDGTSDDRRGETPAPDAHGQAAILLVESLLHGLIARALITVEEAVEIVEIAAEVKAELADEAGPWSARKPQALLDSISHSLKFDLSRKK